MSPFESASRTYAARQWSTMPIRAQGKIPLVDWTKWQTQRATSRQIEAWARTYNYANVGIITGTISNLVVVDLDGEEGLAQLDKFPVTAQVETAHGRHLYFRHSGGLVPNSVKKILPGVDVRGDSGYVVAPPSIHESGTVYAWIKPARPLAKLPVLPEWVVQAVGCDAKHDKQEASHTPTPRAAGPATDYLIPDGRRWDTLWRLGRARKLAGAGAEILEGMIRTENAERCDPPLEELEIRRLVHEVVTRPDRRRGS